MRGLYAALGGAFLLLLGAGAVGVCGSKLAGAAEASPWRFIGDGTYVAEIEVGVDYGGVVKLRCVKVVTDARMVGPVAAISCR